MKPVIWKSTWLSVVTILLLWTFSCSQSESLRVRESAKTAKVVENQKHPEVEFTVSCLECHQDMTPEIAEEWSEGTHGQLNVGCYVCHGDGDIEFAAKPDDTACISCHSSKEVDFTQVEATSCFSCHSGHGLKLHSN